MDQTRLNTILQLSLRSLFNEVVAVNSTASENVDPATGEVVWVGSKTEAALLSFGKEPILEGQGVMRSLVSERL
jgi:Ca2+-transporting ATPase